MIQVDYFIHFPDTMRWVKCVINAESINLADRRAMTASTGTKGFRQGLPRCILRSPVAIGIDKSYEDEITAKYGQVIEWRFLELDQIPPWVDEGDAIRFQHVSH